VAKKTFKFIVSKLGDFLKEKKQEYCDRIFPLKKKNLSFWRDFGSQKIKPLT
jgi:hypothetical protein